MSRADRRASIPKRLVGLGNTDALNFPHARVAATPWTSRSAIEYGSDQSTPRKRMNPPPAEIGAPVAEVETPALLIDLNAFDRNIAKMAEFARTAGVRVRPHAKTHKSTAIALRQIALGAVGQCVQKVGEAEVLVRGGVKDVLVSNQVVGERKLRRLAALANEATIALCFDAPDQVDAASRVARDFGVTLGGLVEIEVGMERCGVAPGRDAAALARRVADAPNLKFRGLQAYHGRAQHMTNYQERAQAIAFAIDAVRETLDVLAAENLPCEIIGAPGPGLSQSRRRAAFIMSCRLAHMYSWTPNMLVSAGATIVPTRNSNIVYLCSHQLSACRRPTESSWMQASSPTAPSAAPRGCMIAPTSK